MHPILFNIGPLEIRAYGVSVALGFLVAIMGAAWIGKKRGINPDDFYDLGLVTILSSVIGARLLYVMVWWKDYAPRPLDIFKVWEGGLVFYGGLIGAVIGCTWWVLKKKLPFYKMADISLPFVALSHAIGRIGCFFNGCCYGVVDEKHGLIFPGAGDNLPHLPTQLYEAGFNLLNAAVLFFLLGKNKMKQGGVFYLYFLNYGVIRFIMEFFRGDAERGKIFFLSTSMFISVFMFLAGTIGLILLYRKQGKAGA